ncbi:MAG: TonB family protein [Pyrinomonadaceae bacterium]|nr:TonB family protein [Pyrinomonadaceae bacterium]
MFGNLIESGSRAHDLKRKGSFFLATFIFYTLLLAAAGVGSIYAYDARLEEEQLEVLAIMRFTPPSARVEAPAPRQEPRPAINRSSVNAVTERTAISINTPVVRSGEVASHDVPEVNSRTLVVISNRNFDPQISGAPTGSFNSHGAGSPDGAALIDLTNEAPPPPRQVPTIQPTAASKPSKVINVSTLLNGRAISKPIPPYPQIAKITRVSGVVTVQILVDETGRVVSAHATNGPQMLRLAAVRAAYEARFSPTMLGKQPVKVSGLMTYNFVLQ